MDIVIPSWILPTLASIIFFAIAIGLSPRSQGDYDFGPVFGCIFILIAGFLSAIAWLIWALIVH